eukprot:m.6471 g.6471  ORF g.6471 m.6471 type:complete len:499 (-) comp3536_c0_seq1:2061-3557(-)
MSAAMLTLGPNLLVLGGVVTKVDLKLYKEDVFSAEAEQEKEIFEKEEFLQDQALLVLSHLAANKFQEPVRHDALVLYPKKEEEQSIWNLSRKYAFYVNEKKQKVCDRKYTVYIRLLAPYARRKSEDFMAVDSDETKNATDITENDKKLSNSKTSKRKAREVVEQRNTPSTGTYETESSQDSQTPKRKQTNRKKPAASPRTPKGKKTALASKSPSSRKTPRKRSLKSVDGASLPSPRKKMKVPASQLDENGKRLVEGRVVPEAFKFQAGFYKCRKCDHWRFFDHPKFLFDASHSKYSRATKLITYCGKFDIWQRRDQPPEKKKDAENKEQKSPEKSKQKTPVKQKTPAKSKKASKKQNSKPDGNTPNDKNEKSPQKKLPEEKAVLGKSRKGSSKKQASNPTAIETSDDSKSATEKSENSNVKQNSDIIENKNGEPTTPNSNETAQKKPVEDFPQFSPRRTRSGKILNAEKPTQNPPEAESPSVAQRAINMFSWMLGAKG